MKLKTYLVNIKSNLKRNRREKKNKNNFKITQLNVYGNN